MNIYGDRRKSSRSRNARGGAHRIDGAAVFRSAEWIDPKWPDVCFRGGRIRGRTSSAPILAGKNGCGCGKSSRAAPRSSRLRRLSAARPRVRPETGPSLPGVRPPRSHTRAGKRRFVAICSWTHRMGSSLVFETIRVGRTWDQRQPLGTVIAGTGNTRRGQDRGRRPGKVIGSISTVRSAEEPWLADRLLAWALDPAAQETSFGSGRRGRRDSGRELRRVRWLAQT